MKQKRQNKKRPSKPVRTISEFEQSFLKELDLYDKVIETTKLISWNQHGIDADGRGLRGTKIFTRQTVVGLSLQRILPRPSSMTHHENVLWDVSSIASLSRNLMEGYLSFYYFGIERVSIEEAELRFFIAQLHRNVEWYEIRKLTDPKDPGLKEFEDGISEQKARIRNHPYLSSLTEVQRKRALRGLEMYKTKADFENELDVCKDLRRNYRHLSNLVHPLPMSIERIDNDRGRGIGSDPDVGYCLICLMLARRFLAASTIGIADHFPDALASKFKDALDSIRPLTSAGFKE
jgi:hypothetical protein